MLGVMTFLSACDKDHKIAPARSNARKTVVVYMAAENSLSGIASEDMSEMYTGRADIPQDCNLVVYVDNSSTPAIFTFSSEKGRELWKNLPEQDSCDSLVFRNTLTEILQAFPADSYGLVMWSHASGWIPGPDNTFPQTQNVRQESRPRKSFGIDNNKNMSGYGSNTGNELNIPVMRRMLEQVGVHWDYIFFDACFMQCVEVDYELRNICDYIIASPAEIPGDGAPYNKIMSSLFRDDIASTLPQIYYDDNKDREYNMGSYTTKGGLMLSVCQTNEMDSLASVMKSFIPRLFQGKREYDMYGTQGYCQYTINSVWKPEYYDLGSAMNILLASPSDYEALCKQLSRTYPVALHSPYWLSEFFYHYQGVISDADHLACVSMFIPNMKYDHVDYNSYLHTLGWYKAAGWDQTGW